jgi:hypothetical protein
MCKLLKEKKKRGQKKEKNLRFWEILRCYWQAIENLKSALVGLVHVGEIAEGSLRAEGFG